MPFTPDGMREVSIAERFQLVGETWDGVAQEGAGPSLDEAQRTDLGRRLDEYEGNPGATHGWPGVRERLDRSQ